MNAPTPPSQSLVTLHNAIATPTVIDVNSQTFSGVIYDSNGLICRNAQRTRDGCNEWQPSDPEVLSASGLYPILPGRSLYLGHYTGHYGHFLLESLSRLWALSGLTLSDSIYERVIFHPFLHKTPPVRGFSPAQMCFASFGISPQHVRLVDEPLRFESLTVPSAMLLINQSVDPSLSSTYKKIVAHCLSRESSRLGFWRKLAGWPESGPLRLYLSRRQAKGFHPMLNERQVERVFVDAGFRVLHPEKWSFEQQVALFQRAEVIAGVEGSALHNSVFMRSEALVINIGTAREPTGDILNQRLCDSLSGVVPIHIPFKGEIVRGSKAVYDVEFLKEALAAALK